MLNPAAATPKIAIHIERAVTDLRSRFLFSLPAVLQPDVALIGGCIRDSILGEDIQDYDFVTASSDVEQHLIEYFRLGASHEQITPTVANFEWHGFQIQVIRSVHLDMRSPHLGHLFDYTIGCVALTTKRFTCHPTFIEDSEKRRLRISQIAFPLSTLERLQKYVKKGYTADGETLVAIARALARLDFNDMELVRSQLTPA